MTTPAAAAGRSANGPPGSVRDSVRSVISLADPWRRELRYGVASGATQQVLSLAGASIAAYAVARAVRGASYNSLSLYLIGLVVIVLPQVRTPWLEAISFQAIGNRVGLALRRQVYDALSDLTPAGLSGRRSGELGSTAMGDVAVIQRFFSETLSTLIIAGIVPLLALAALAVLDWRLALVVGPFLATAAVAPVWLHTRTEDHTGDLHDHLADLSAEIVDSVQGLREILAFGAETTVLADLDARADKARHLQAIHDRHSATEQVLTELLATAGPLLVLAIGAALSAHHQLSPTLLPPAVVLAALAFAPVARFGHAAKSLRHVAVAAERVFTLLATPVPVQDHVRVDTNLPARPGVAFERVSFRYNPADADALDDVTFTVSPGQTVALVGHSGAGKSTCANLLLRFWDPDAGSITIGGTNIADVPQAEHHRHVGFVSQDIYLFNTTIRDNVRLGRPDATDSEVIAAARAAQAWEFIAALPDGLDTNVGERGIQLSGGQRQRVAIARVVLADPPILVLDEPVSNLDTANEQALRAALSHLRTGRTTIIVAHRLSTTRAADQIVVLDHGRVAETGTHHQLLAKHGTYAQLVADQLQSTTARPGRSWAPNRP